MRKRIASQLILFGFLLSAPVLAVPVVTAVRCDGCTYAQFEQRAIGRGLGSQYLYDFTGRQLLHFEVSREPASGGRYLYEAIALPVAAEYMTYFNAVLDHRRQFGLTNLVVTVNLPAAGGPHGSMSVFDLFGSDGSGRNLENWLAAHITSVAAMDGSDAAKSIVKLKSGNASVAFQQDPLKVTVFVNFKNGQSQCEFNQSGDSCKMIPGTAIDSVGHTIPSSRGEFAELPYEFAGGTTSANYQEFLDLVRRLGIPIGNGRGMWACTSVPGVGQRCQLIR